jgi:3-hydroxyacyl-[acyl-carrier-protein] dehydratase
MLDRIVEWEQDKRLVAIKNVTANEPYFPGHFPDHAVMPGVLIVEAMAQAAAMLGLLSSGQKSDGKNVYYFVGIDDARFKRPVRPGDQLVLEVELLRLARGIGKFTAVAKVDGAIAAEARLLCALRPAK